MNLIDRLDSPATARLVSSPKDPSKRETAAICRDRAAADLLESAAMINANQRIRLETSAASWTARALMLERVESGIARKVVEAAASPHGIGDEINAEPPRL